MALAIAVAALVAFSIAATWLQRGSRRIARDVDIYRAGVNDGRIDYTSHGGE